MGAILDLFKDENYTFSDCQIVRYDRTRTEMFPEGYLTLLYQKTRAGRHPDRKGVGSLQEAFCGMIDLSHDNVTAYLSTRNPLLILGVWVKSEFRPAGYAFFPALKGERSTRFAFGAYTFFKEWWGTPQITILSMLGLAYFFREFGLHALIGERYATNDRTARFMRQFGFHDCGILQRYLIRDNRLVAGVLSECLSEDFERAAELILAKATGVDKDGQGVKLEP